MNQVAVLVVLSLVEELYHAIFDRLTVITLDYAVSDHMIYDDTVKLDLNLGPHFTVNDPSYILVNRLVHVTLPYPTFPRKQDLLSFEYTLLLFNTETHEQNDHDAVVCVKLIDCLAGEVAKG